VYLITITATEKMIINRKLELSKNIHRDAHNNLQQFSIIRPFTQNCIYVMISIYNSFEKINCVFTIITFMR